MALQKTPIAINFTHGLETKSDPFQISPSNFLALQNSVFSTTGRLTKRNGYANLTNLPDKAQTTLTTLNDNLIATGANLYAYSKDSNQWLNQGIVQPAQIATQPLVRVSTSQTSPDSAIAENGLACLAYIDNGVSYYQVSDTTTGQQIVNRTALVATATNPRVFVLGIYFIITYIAVISTTPTLQFVAIPMAKPSAPKTAANISASVDSVNAGYDAIVASNDTMFISWYGSANTVQTKSISASLIQSTAVTIAASVADLMSVTFDSLTNYVWISYWDSNTKNGYSTAYNLILGVLVAPTQIIDGVEISTITSVAINGTLTVFYQDVNNYTYQDTDSDDIRSDLISSLTVVPPNVGTGAGTASAPDVVLRSVGLASKAFFGDYTYTLTSAPNISVTTKTLPDNFLIDTFISSTIYMMATYGDIDQTNSLDNSNQPTYFLIDSTGQIYARLAYSNGGGYTTTQVLPSVSFNSDTFYAPYLIADFLATVNKTTNPPAGTPSNAIYTQYGVNLVAFSLNTGGQQSSEIAGALHLTGGQLWEYDGVRPVEHGFHVWPENILAAISSSPGSISAQTYNYVATYEWTDNQGMLHRSAPSIPTTIEAASPSVKLDIPTLRLTSKLSPNPVRIVVYRWSTAQQTYYQITSITSPIVNDTTIDSIEYIDTLSDEAILGQTLLYTTGGVVENIAAPASIDSCLFDNRLWLINAENPNELWYSKQVIQNVPVEMSDLLTIYVAPTTGAQGSTGPSTAISAMDDKLIIFKRNAMYYINGSGPDNTGANSTYSNATFITAAVGCTEPNSVVLTPTGIMFKSDKGIWMLGRDLSTQYIGAPVEIYNNLEVLSAETIPGTNQVRFILEDNITLMYDYFVGQWATHTNTRAISATLYQGKHTYLNSNAQIFQETAGMFTDGSEPVLLSLTTAWINVAGVQGLERFYFANLLGTYFTPFKLNVTLAYNYNPSAQQSIIVTPQGNPAPDYGDEALWGSGGPFGGSEGNIFSARIFPQIQKCQSFQVTIQEVYDPSLGVAAGQGLSLSGLALIVGMKRGYRTQKAARSFG